MQPVLVVDDDRDIRETVRMLLEDEGYEVYEAAEGQSALGHLLHATASTVVLLDLNMPVMDGRQVLATVARNETLATRHSYLVVSAYADQPLPESAHALVREHRIPFIRKPFELDDLLAQVATAVENLHARVRVGEPQGMPRAHLAGM